MNIYVGNLPFNISEDEIRDAFEQYGAVDSARIIMDKFTNRSRGFGFVEMPDGDEAQAAIDTLHESQLGGRSLVVNEARPRTERRPQR